MALDRDQVGLLFNIDVNAMDARQQLELFQGVVEGMTAEVRDQFGRMNTQIAATTRETGKLAQSFGDAASNQLRGFLGQFGMIGDALGDMIPALSGTSAAIVGLTGVTVAAGAALAATAVKAMDYTGKIDDLAQVTNLTTETIQSLQLAATLSGQSFEDVSQTAIIFQKRIEEAKKGNAELMATFKALGVDLNGPVDQAFRQTLERLGQVADGSTKTATTLELFGKSGAKLLPVMDQVGGSFDNLVTRARDLGIVLDQEAINKSNELADRLDILKLRLSAITTDIGIGAIRIFDDWATAVGRVSITFKQLFTDVSTIVPNLKKLLTGAFLATLPGGSPISLSTLFSEGGGGATGFQGPGIDPVTGLPEITLPGKTGGATGKAGAAARAINLPSGDAVKRTYESFRQAIIAEERATQAQREKLRIDAIQGEEAKLRDALIRQDEAIAKARADAAAGARTSRAGVLQQVVANLEAEKALTMQAIEEIETARVQAMMRFVEAAKKQTQKRLEDEKAKELALLQNFQAIREAIRRGLEQTYVDVGFSPQAAAAIVAQQDLLGRQLTMWEQVQVGATSLAQVIQQTMPSMAATMVNTSMAVSDALANMVSAFATGRGTMRQVVGAFLDAALSPLRDYLLTKSKAHFALGLADLALQNYAGAAKNFLAATALAGAAGLIKAGTSAIGGGGMGAAAPIAPSSGGQFLAQDRGAGGTMIREQGGRRSSEPQVIIIRAETEPGVMVSKVIQDYKSNGEMRSTLRRDLLGEF